MPYIYCYVVLINMKNLKPYIPPTINEQIENWIFDSHYWIDVEINNMILTKCKWCGYIMPNTPDIKLCKENPIIKELCKVTDNKI